MKVMTQKNVVITVPVRPTTTIVYEDDEITTEVSRTPPDVLNISDNQREKKLYDY